MMKGYIKGMLLIALLLPLSHAFAADCFKMETGGREVSCLDVSRKIDCSMTFSLFDRSSVGIGSLSVSGKIEKNNKNYLVRIILKDKQGKEYLVLESYDEINDTASFRFTDYCEETALLTDAVQADSIKVIVRNAVLTIDTVNYTVAQDIKEGNDIEKRRTVYNELRKEQLTNIAGRINNYNKIHHKLWRAGVTEVSMKSYEIKKRVMGFSDEGCTDGFEYYLSGIFEMGENIGNSSTRSLSQYVDNFDWRNRHGINWITSVKDQSTGGGCWAFTAIGVTEALVNLYYNRKLDYNLSEQEIISCSGAGNNNTGGSPYYALQWIAGDGVSEELSFPFSNSDEPCSNKGSFSELVSINSCLQISNHTSNNCDSVRKALIKYGPLASGIRYIGSSYHSHSMTLVGYATLHAGDTVRYFSNFSQRPNNFDVIQEDDDRIGMTYWIFKNSYGTDRYFDHQGYSYVLFNDLSCFNSTYYATTPIISLMYSDEDIVVVDADGDGYYSWGIGTKPSHSPSWVSEEPDGDDSDINIGPMDSFGNIVSLPDGITINTPISYTTNNTIVKRIGIVNNGILTITGNSTLSGNAKIRVCEGGILIVDGGSIINADIEMVPGGTLIIRNGGCIYMASDKVFSAPKGAVLQVDSGQIL